MNFIKTYTSDWFCSYKAFISSRTCLSPSSWNIQNDIGPYSLILPPSLQQYSIYTMFIFDLHILSKSKSFHTYYDGYKCWQGWKEIRTLIHCRQECKMVHSTGKKSNGSSKKINILPYQPAILLLGIYSRIKNIILQKHVHKCLKQYYSLQPKSGVDSLMN